MNADEHQLLYALLQPRPASRRRVFACFLPGSFVTAAAIAFGYVVRLSPSDNPGDIGVMCVVMAISPVALWGFLAVGREAVRPHGGRAVLWGLAWNAALIFSTLFTLWTIVRFGLLKHS